MFERILVHTNKINAVEYFRASGIIPFICRETIPAHMLALLAVSYLELLLKSGSLNA